MLNARRSSTKTWFDVRGRHAGYVAFALHRATGILLVLYLFLHFGVLTSLLAGPKAYDGMIGLMSNPVVEILELGLIFVILYHGLNGVRLVLMALNIGVRWHEVMFWVVLAASIALTVASATMML